jgi:hypothetical protein
MPRSILSPPNAILFVLDPTNKNVVVPVYVDDQLTAATSTCVSIGTQADVDGDVEVSLEVARVAPIGMQHIFFGVIETPGGKIAVVTSQFQRVLEIDVSVKTIEVSIWADDLCNPACVAVGVQSSLI